MTAVKSKMKMHPQEAESVGCPGDWLHCGIAQFLPCPTYSMQTWTVALCTQ